MTVVRIPFIGTMTRDRSSKTGRVSGSVRGVEISLMLGAQLLRWFALPPSPAVDSQDKLTQYGEEN